MAAREAPTVPSEGAEGLTPSGRLPRSFFARPSPAVAQDLLGQVLVRALPGTGRLAARIVETEAYEPTDPASHSFRGATPRNATMFGPPGHLYVYFTYGMHHCMNVVTGPRGHGSAVLLRAGEPVEGLDEMVRRRAGRAVTELCSGPARWCQAFGIDRDLDGEDLVRGTAVWIEGGSEPAVLARGPRIGIRRGRDLDWRFTIPGNPYVSAPRRTGASSVRPERS